MKLEKWALIAEIVGGVAIVLSLIFVGAEIRRNTAATYAATYDRLLSDHMNLSIAEANNPEISLAYLYFENSELLDSTDDPQYLQGRSIWMALARIYERAYFAHEYGRLGDSEWGRYQNHMCGEVFRAMLPKLDYPGEQLVFAREFWNYLQDCEPDFQL